MFGGIEMKHAKGMTQEERDRLEKQYALGQTIYAALFKAIQQFPDEQIKIHRHPFLGGRYSIFVGVLDGDANAGFITEPSQNGRGIFQVHVDCGRKGSVLEICNRGLSVDGLDNHFYSGHDAELIAMRLCDLLSKHAQHQKMQRAQKTLKQVMMNGLMGGPFSKRFVVYSGRL